MEPRSPEFSIVGLLQEHLVSPRLAALLWSLLAGRASFIVVGGHYRGAGKTTTLSALTSFFPVDTELVFTRGPSEDFAFLERTQPHRAYIMVNEFSDHTPRYLWGEKAARVFQLTAQGYAFAGTMHAESPEEILTELESPPVALPRSAIARSLQLLVFQAAMQGPEEVMRRITALYWLQPAERGPGGLGIKSLAVWEPKEDKWRSFSSPETWSDLARWRRAAPESLRQEVDKREKFLLDLMNEGVTEYEKVSLALQRYSPQETKA